MSELSDALQRAFPVFSVGGLSNAIYPADENSEGEGWAVDNDDWRIISDAARKWLSDTIVCPTCGGSGTKQTLSGIVDDMTGQNWPEVRSCPDCIRGRTASPEVRERMAKGLAVSEQLDVDSWWGKNPDDTELEDDYRRMALAAWLAEHQEDE